jgi:hypothetical protein
VLPLLPYGQLFAVLLNFIHCFLGMGPELTRKRQGIRSFEWLSTLCAKCSKKGRLRASMAAAPP